MPLGETSIDLVEKSIDFPRTEMTIGGPEGLSMQCNHDPFGNEEPEESYIPPAKTEPDTVCCEEVRQYLELRALVYQKTELHIDPEDTDMLRAQKIAEHKAAVSGKQKALELLCNITASVAIAEAREAVKHLQHMLEGNTTDPFRFYCSLEYLRIESLNDQDVSQHDHQLRQAEEVLAYGEREASEVLARIETLEQSKMDTGEMQAHKAALQDQKRALIIAGKNFDTVEKEIKNVTAEMSEAAEKNTEIDETISVLRNHLAMLETRNADMKSLLESITLTNASLHAHLFAGTINTVSKTMRDALQNYVSIIDDHKKTSVHFPGGLVPLDFSLPLLTGFKFCMSENGNMIIDPDLERCPYVCKVRL